MENQTRSAEVTVLSEGESAVAPDELWELAESDDISAIEAVEARAFASLIATVSSDSEA